jgi:hypothetical protein
MTTLIAMKASRSRRRTDSLIVSAFGGVLVDVLVELFWIDVQAQRQLGSQANTEERMVDAISVTVSCNKATLISSTSAVVWPGV